MTTVRYLRLFCQKKDYFQIQLYIHNCVYCTEEYKVLYATTSFYLIEDFGTDCEENFKRVVGCLKKAVDGMKEAFDSDAPGKPLV